MIAPSGSSFCTSTCPAARALLSPGRCGHAISANLEDTVRLPLQSEVLKIVKEQKWVSEEYEHLWRRDGGGSAALTSHGILSAFSTAAAQRSYPPELTVPSLLASDTKRRQVILLLVLGEPREAPLWRRIYSGRPLQPRQSTLIPGVPQQASEGPTRLRRLTNQHPRPPCGRHSGSCPAGYARDDLRRETHF